MNSVTRLLSIVGLTVAGLMASSAPALADHSGIGVTVYGGGRHNGYALSWHDSDRGHRDHRGDYRYARSYPSRYRDSSRPVYGRYSHPYGYYGFTGGYYGVYDGNSYEEVYARAYDDGYNDGFNESGHRRGSDARAYRKGYDQGYRDGARDGRNEPRRYDYR